MTPGPAPEAWCQACRKRAGGTQDGPTLASVLAGRRLDADTLAARLAYVDAHLPAGLCMADAVRDATEDR